MQKLGSQFLNDNDQPQWRIRQGLYHEDYKPTTQPLAKMISTSDELEPFRGGVPGGFLEKLYKPNDVEPGSSRRPVGSLPFPQVTPPDLEGKATEPQYVRQQVDDQGHTLSVSSPQPKVASEADLGSKEAMGQQLQNVRVQIDVELMNGDYDKVISLREKERALMQRIGQLD